MKYAPVAVLALVVTLSAQIPQPADGLVSTQCWESDVPLVTDSLTGSLVPAHSIGFRYLASTSAGRLRVETASNLGIASPPFTGDSVVVLDSTGGAVTNELVLHVDPQAFPAREFEISMLAYNNADEVDLEDVFVISDGVTAGFGVNAAGSTGAPGLDGFEEHLLRDWGATLSSGQWTHVVLRVDAAFYAAHPSLSSSSGDYRIVFRQRDDMTSASDGLALDCIEVRPVGSARVDVANPAAGTGATDAPFRSIQAAINAASNGTAVIVAAGTYNETIDFNGRAIEVRGAGMDATIVDAALTGRVVEFSTGEGPGSVLRDMTITGGEAPTDGHGGGILCSGTSPRIARCRVSGNRAGPGMSIPPPQTGNAGNGGSGGGIACIGGSATISGCVIENNTAGDGGSVFFFGFGGNGGSGGGVWLAGTGVEQPRIERCIIRGNAGGQPGGVSFGTPSFNLGGYGGGVAMFDVAAVVSNCLIDGNSTGDGPPPYAAPGLGGGISYTALVCATGARVEGCTLVNNSSPDGFAGIWAQHQISNCPQVLFCKDTIVWDNTPSMFQFATMFAFYDYCNLEGGASMAVGVGNISLDPLFAGPADYRIQSDSPCFNTGDPAPAPAARDLAGIPRSLGGRRDIGAYEFDTCSLRPGSSEGLLLLSTINGGGVPGDCHKTIGGGDALDVTLLPDNGDLVGLTPVLLAQAVVTGTIFNPIPGFPEFHVDPTLPLFVAYDGAAPPPAGVTALPQDGLSLQFIMPMNVSSVTLRLQGFALGGAAANGIFAASPATDFEF